jgi:hypothetical protein
LFLYKSATAQSHDSGASAAQLFEHLFEGSVFRPPKFGFAGIAENLRHRATFTRLYAVVEIFKDPIQELAEDAAHAAFPSAHKADQKHSMF